MQITRTVMDVANFRNVLFFLDLSVLAFGFNFNFPLSGDEGTFSSPNYPNPYPLNANCTWTIEASREKRIRITFIDFRLEKNKRCLYDYLKIREVSSSYQTAKTMNSPKYCGYNKPGVYYSKGNRILISFISDSLNQERGFKATWKILLKEDADFSGPSPVASKCPTVTKTITVTKNSKCKIPKNTIKPSKCLCNTPVRKTIYTTVVVDNRIDQHHSMARSDIIQPTVHIGSNGKQRNIDWQNIKCNSTTVQLNSDNTEQNDRTSLVIAFACLVAILLLSNIILLVILCRRENRDTITTHTSHLLKCLPTQTFKQPRSPDIYCSAVNNRPTLRVLNGDIIIVPGDKRTQNSQTLAQSPNSSNSMEMQRRMDSGQVENELISTNDRTRFPFHLISPSSPSMAETTSIGSDFNEETRNSRIFSSASEPESEY